MEVQDKKYEQWFHSVRTNDILKVRKLIKTGIDPFKTFNNQTARQIVKGHLTKISRMKYKDHIRVYMYNQMYNVLSEAEQQRDEKSNL